MEKNRSLSHFKPPDTGHRIRNGTDRGHAKIGFYGKMIVKYRTGLQIFPGVCLKKALCRMGQTV